MLTQQQMLDQNRHTWNVAAPTTDKPSSNLPFWGPYGIGPELNLLPNIENQSFIDIGCGCGRSIKFLLDHKAKFVRGIDISDAQIAAAKDLLQSYDPRLYHLNCTAMENKVNMRSYDFVISVYALGWATNLDTVFSNIYSYLKPGGQLIFSWEHPFFNRTWFDGRNVICNRSYFDKAPYLIENFRNSGPAFLIPRTISDWQNALSRNGFNFTLYEPDPQIISDDNHPHHNNYYADEKAAAVPSTIIFACQKV